jgi:hypothetical protein
MTQTLKEAIDNLGKIDEGAKAFYVNHREAVDDIIRENKRVGQIIHDYSKVSFKKDAAKLEKALTVSAKLARKFWADWNSEF